VIAKVVSRADSFERSKSRAEVALVRRL